MFTDCFKIAADRWLVVARLDMVHTEVPLCHQPLTETLTVFALDYGLFHRYNQFAINFDIFPVIISRRFCHAAY